LNRIIIFGGTGSLGRKLIERYLQQPHVKLLVYSRDEAKHWTIKNELSDNPKRKNVDFMVGDIRDVSRVSQAIQFFEPTVIIIAAALKQVDTCELSPRESIATNLLGTQNVLSAVTSYSTLRNRELKVLFVSTDKACAPVNVYGMCKAISERVITSADYLNPGTVTYLCTRYGNVLESRGSIIPLFKYQAENAECLTVTDPDMTRFVMTLDDSVDLINRALSHGKSGETWIPILPAMRIGDLAEIFAELHDKTVKIIGLRPGEKLHEDLICESESVRSKISVNPIDNTDRNYVIGPALGSNAGNRFTYSSSDDVMSKETLRAHLQQLGILDAPLETFKGLNIEEIRK
jgi:UDP-glucose 4-epimerase